MHLRKMRSNLLAILFGVGVAFLMAEAAMRIICFAGVRPGYSIVKLLKETPRYAWSQFTGPTFIREEAKYKFNGGFVKINSQGYRGSQLFPAKKEGLRLIFLGGSSVFDLQAEEKRDWPTQVGEILNTKGLKTEVMNAGVPGHRSWDSLGKMYAELHMWNPDYIFFSEAWNDLKSFRDIAPENSLMAQNLMLKHPETPNPPGSRLTVLDRLFAWSWLYAKLRVKFYKFKYQEGKPVSSEEDLSPSFSEIGPKQYSLHLYLLYQLSKRIGAKLVLIKQPRLVALDNTAKEKGKIAFQWSGLTHDGLLQAFEACDREMELLAKEYPDIILINASAEMNGKAEYFVDHVHTTVQGSKKLSEIVAGAMTAQLP